MKENMENDNFINPFPDRYGYLRIGTPVNIDINKIFDNMPALDMITLYSNGHILINANSTQYKNMQGGGFDLKSQDAFSTSIDVNVGLKKMTELGFKSQVAYIQNVCKGYSTSYIAAYANQKTDIQMVGNITPGQLLACATDDFKNKYTAIVEGANALYKDPDNSTLKENLKAAIKEFYITYGTGYISELHLSSFAIFKGSAKYTSEVIDKKLNISGSVSISGLSLSANSAAEYSKNHFDSNFEGVFQTQSFSMPKDSPCDTWINIFQTAFSNSQLSKLSDPKEWEKAFNPSLAKASEIKFNKNTPKEPIKISEPPKKIAEDAISELKIEEFKEAYKKNHGVYPSDPEKQYKEYIEELKKAASVNDNDINKAKDSISKSCRFVSEIYCNAHKNNVVLGNNSKQDYDFGTYGIIGYEYSDWGTILPALKTLNKSLTLSQVVMGQLMIWISIRSLFSQYLSFCKNFTDIVEDSLNVYSYNKALNIMINWIWDYISSDNDLSKYSLMDIEEKFIETLKDNGFQLIEHYEYLKDNYEWLKKIPFGAIPVSCMDELPSLFINPPSQANKDNSNSNKYWFFDKYHCYSYSDETHQHQGYYPTNYIESASSPSVELLLRSNAYRLYPILSSDSNNKPLFIWVTYVAENNRDDLCGVSLYSDTEKEINHWPVDETRWRGMFRSIYPYSYNTFSNIRNSAKFHCINVKPERDSYDKDIWKLEKTNNKRPTVLWYQSSILEPIPEYVPNYITDVV